MRAGLNLPGGRGGEKPHTFGNDERVAAEDDGDVMDFSLNILAMTIFPFCKHLR